MKRAVEAIDQEVLGTSVEVDAVNLSIAEGSGEIRGLEIGNPVGFEGDYSMRFNRIKVVLEANDINEELVVIKQVIIDGADIAAEVQGQRSNLQALLDNAASELALITGQKASIRKARKSVANFKLREGQAIGCCVTLRNVRMWEFFRENDLLPDAQRVISTPVEGLGRHAAKVADSG